MYLLYMYIYWYLFYLKQTLACGASNPITTSCDSNPTSSSISNMEQVFDFEVSFIIYASVRKCHSLARQVISIYNLVTVFWSFHQRADFIPPSFAGDKTFILLAFYLKILIIYF